METIKIFEAFSGYGSQSLALKRLARDYPQFSFECVGYSDINKYACKAYDALHPYIKSYGDITAVDWSTVPDFDILTWSSPCQSVSSAGKLKGMTEGTDDASAVIWSIDRCLAVKHPRYILLENVANIVCKRFIGEFNRFQDLLRSFGYKCHTKIMNAKQYGVPQNRERLFLVATSEEVDGYHFPEPFPLEKRLKDVLEQDVDERYYLSADRVAGLLKSTLKERGRGNGFVFSPKTEESDTANCITTHEGGRKTDNFIAEDALKLVGNLYDGNPQAGRAYDPDGIAPTLDTCNGGNREPKIITSPHGYNRGNIIDVFPTVKASAYQYNNHVIETKVNIAAIRGRSDGDWHGSEHKQRLEEGGDICGAITSVAKDNMLVERSVLGFVRDSNGEIVHRPEVEVFNCVTAGKRDNTQNYVKEEYEPVEKSFIEDFYACREPREYAEVAPTLRSEREGLKVKEQYLLNGDKDGCFSTLTTGHDRARNITEPKGGHKQIGVLEYDGRIVCIRRLTERELFRIMDVDEPDIDILLSAGIPKTQLEKLAGNSIVVNCLYHIFRKMFIDVENESQQTLLF